MSRQKLKDRLRGYYNNLRGDKDSHERVNSGDDEKQSDSGHILEVQTIKIADK